METVGLDNPAEQQTGLLDLPVEFPNKFELIIN